MYAVSDHGVNSLKINDLISYLLLTCMLVRYVFS